MNMFKCVDGVMRDIGSMSDMHLAMICKMLELKPTYNYRSLLSKIGTKLINSNFTLSDWIEEVNNIRNGSFKFYNDSPELDEYYINLVRRYKVFLAPRCLQFKAKYPCLERDMRHVKDMLENVVKDSDTDYGININEAESMIDEITYFLHRSIAQLFYYENTDRIIELAGFELPDQSGDKFFTRQEIKKEVYDAVKEVYGVTSGTDCIYWPYKLVNGNIWAVVLGYEPEDDVCKIKMAYHSEKSTLDKSYELDWYMPEYAMDELEITLSDGQDLSDAVDFLIDHFCL